MTLEGMLGPNSRLDDAAGISIDAPDAIAIAPDGRLLVSSGTRVLVLDAWGSEPVAWAAFDRRVTALCCSPGGRVAVGLAGGTVVVLDLSGQAAADWVPAALPAFSVVDCVFRSDDELLLVDCGYGADASVLAQAAWDDATRGQLLSVHRSGELRVVLSGLHCPMGVCLDPRGEALVSLLERAAIVGAGGSVRQGGYPGYAARLRRIGSGYALACLSRRDPLIEFLKTERAFVAEMKRTIDPRHWIAPRIEPQFSHDVPIELGATRLFGEIKPWAPSFSYGLLVELDDRLMPTGSAQSRANGRRHAICDVARWQDEMIAVSKASGEIVNLGKGGTTP
jgi:hypothetical protein